MSTDEIVKRYTDGLGIDALCKEYHLGKLKIKAILSEAGVPLKSRGGVKKNVHYVVPDWRVEKYPPIEGYHYIAKHKVTGVIYNDYMNDGGFLTSHVKNNDKVEVPTLYSRRQYYMRTGNYWWEQWFDILPEKDKPVKKCPYCDWATEDVDNRSGAFEQHLKKVHNISKDEYIKNNPDDRSYFALASHTQNLQMETRKDKYVVCEICGKKLSRIDTRHLSGHGITKGQYIERFGKPTVCQTLHDRLHMAIQEVNRTMTFHKESSAEKEIKELLHSWGIATSKNRTLLNGKEIDIFMPEYKMGIEYNGNFYHTEWRGGKGRYYHIDKTALCEESGVRLIQIFEDEWMCHKDICIDKLKHILKLNSAEKRIMARKCTISPIEAYEAEHFLTINHIQGFCRATVYLGAFYQNKLIGVMTFTKNGDWELNRFATLLGYTCVGLGSKLFRHFVKLYNPAQVKSFADRRWTSDMSNNFYSSIGFTLDKILPPDYKYYNQKIDRYDRIHKFNFRKQRLHKKYGFSLTMTETEMAKELGYDRIWDCGLLKYIWKA